MSYYVALKTSGGSEIRFDKYADDKDVKAQVDVFGYGLLTNLKVTFHPSSGAAVALPPAQIAEVMRGQTRQAFELSGIALRPLDLWIDSASINGQATATRRYNPPAHLDKFDWPGLLSLIISAEADRYGAQAVTAGTASSPTPVVSPATTAAVSANAGAAQQVSEAARHTAVVEHDEPTVEQAQEALDALAQQAAQSATDLFKDQPDPILVGVQTLADGSLDEIWYYPRWVKKHGANKKRWRTEIDVLRKRQDDTGRNPLIPRHIAMPGDAGNGKTFACMIAFGPNVRKVSCSEETLASDMAGYKAIESDGVGGIQERLIMGEVLKAYTHKHDDSCKRDEAGRCGGEVVILDEGDRPNPQVMTLMHPMMDGSPTFTYLGVEYTRGEPTFLVVLTYNPHSEGSYIADPLWSRMGRPLRWEVSLWTAKRLGVRQELLDFTAKMLTMIRNGDSNVQAPSLRLLLRANAEWDDNGEESGWGELLSENRASSRTVWLEVIKARVGTKMGRELENSEGAMLIADDDWSLIASDSHPSDPSDGDDD